MIPFSPRASLLAGALAAIGASLCCVGPLVLLGLGVGGAWIANLTALEPYRPMFTGLALVFLGLAYHRIHLAAPRCETGAACANPAVARRQRLTFWTTALPLLGLLAAPWFAPLFY